MPGLYMSLFHHNLVADPLPDFVEPDSLFGGKRAHEPVQVGDALVGGRGGVVNDQRTALGVPDVHPAHVPEGFDRQGGSGIRGHDPVHWGDNEFSGTYPTANMGG